MMFPVASFAIGRVQPETFLVIAVEWPKRGRIAVKWRKVIPRCCARQAPVSGFDILMKVCGHPQVIEDIPNN